MALGGARDAHVGSLVGITSQSRGNQDVAHSMSTLLSSFVVAVPFPSCLTRIVAFSSQHIVFWVPWETIDRTRQGRAPTPVNSSACLFLFLLAARDLPAHRPVDYPCYLRNPTPYPYYYPTGRCGGNPPAPPIRTPRPPTLSQLRPPTLRNLCWTVASSLAAVCARRREM